MMALAMHNILSGSTPVVNTPDSGGGETYVMVPTRLIHSSISDAAFRVVCGLLTYTRPGHWRAWPAQQTLADQLHRSRASIQRAEAELIEAGWATSDQHRRSAGCFGHRIIDLSPIAQLLPDATRDRASNLRSGLRHSSPSPRIKSATQSRTRSVSVKEQQELDPAVVVMLKEQGVPEAIATTLAPIVTKTRRTQAEIEAIVREWRRQGERIRNIGGWFRRALEQGYKPAVAESYERPQRVIRDPRPPLPSPTTAPPKISTASSDEARAAAMARIRNLKVGIA